MYHLCTTAPLASRSQRRYHVAFRTAFHVYVGRLVGIEPAGVRSAGAAGADRAIENVLPRLHWPKPAAFHVLTYQMPAPAASMTGEVIEHVASPEKQPTPADVNQRSTATAPLPSRIQSWYHDEVGTVFQTITGRSDATDPDGETSVGAGGAEDGDTMLKCLGALHGPFPLPAFHARTSHRAASDASGT